MKKFALFAGLAGFCMLISVAFSRPDQKPAASPVKWYTWNEAVALQATAPKKIFIDVYTDWCGWCKVMDRQTFTDSTVAAYLNQNFYPVKFNAEQRETVEFNGHKFEFQDNGQRGGVHQLAYSLLDGKLGYPSFVFLNEKFERIMISPGYKDPNGIMPELRFAAEEQYKSMSLDEYKSKNK